MSKPKYIYHESESLDAVVEYANSRTHQFKIVTVFPVMKPTYHLRADLAYVVVLERLPAKKPRN